MKVGPVKPREKRILGRIDSYHTFMTEPSAKSVCRGNVGKLLGVYENTPDESVYVAEERLIVSSKDRDQVIRYSDIETAMVDTNSADKWSAFQIDVKTKDGESYEVPIRNGKGRFRDVWEFYRFLDRVYKDIQQRTPDKLDHSTRGAYSDHKSQHKNLSVSEDL